MTKKHLDLTTITAACRPGGASVLTVNSELAPAAGPHAGVAPPRFVRGSQAVYAFETRYVDIDGSGPQAVSTVVLDSKGSALNRIEEALSTAIHDEVGAVSSTPRIRVSYDGLPPVTCLELPHRAFDGHVRAGTVDGKPTTDSDRYRAARNVTAANARPLLELSPISLVLGAWDSTRKTHQVRFRSALVGEVIGVLADQGPDGRDVSARGAARFEHLAPSVRLSPEDMESLVQAQEAELSVKNVEGIRKDIARAKKGGTISASPLGLGSIPPSLDGLGLVSCQRIIRSHVLSFSALRQLRFGLGHDGDAAARALLAALGLNGLARSFDELLLRANCDLIETAEPVFTLDGRYGRTIPLEALRAEAADELLEAAVQAARGFGVEWQGQVFEVVGNPLIVGAIAADTDDEGN